MVDLRLSCKDELCQWIAFQPLLTHLVEAALSIYHAEMVNTVIIILLKVLAFPIPEQVGLLTRDLILTCNIQSPLIQTRMALLHDALHNTSLALHHELDLPDIDTYAPDPVLISTVFHDYTRKQTKEEKIEECCSIIALLAGSIGYQKDVSCCGLAEWCIAQAEKYNKNAIIVQAAIRMMCRFWKSMSKKVKLVNP